MLTILVSFLGHRGCSFQWRESTCRCGSGGNRYESPAGRRRWLWEWGEQPASPEHPSASPGHRSLQYLSCSAVIQPFLLSLSTWRTSAAHKQQQEEAATYALRVTLVRLLSSAGPCCGIRAHLVLHLSFIAPGLAQHQPKNQSLLRAAGLQAG